ncbi:transcription repressor NadR [Veillonella magna]|uniref:transcription repressor NadR n=1 Tax=Veillonella magna TaxID=464322 RepID=UPI00041295D5|nr:transcription repressor NadR [Veillonella magna]
MRSKERQQTIIRYLAKANAPIAGGELAEMCDVSRPIIVGDIAALRQEGYPILSTPRGYTMTMPGSGSVKRIIVCRHDATRVEEELTTIITMGGVMYTIGVEHDVYGHIEASLYIRTLEECRQFIEKFASSANQLLSTVSGGVHTHLIGADTPERLSLIIDTLRQKGFLYETVVS